MRAFRAIISENLQQKAAPKSGFEPSSEPGLSGDRVRHDTYRGKPTRRGPSHRGSHSPSAPRDPNARESTPIDCCTIPNYHLPIRTRELDKPVPPQRSVPAWAVALPPAPARSQSAPELEGQS